MFRTEDFWKKFLVLFGVVLIANLLINWSGLFAPELNDGKSSIWELILFIAGLIIMIIPYGHSIALLKSKIEDSSSNSLPWLNFLDSFVSGVKVVIAGLILVGILFAILFVLYTLNYYFASLVGDFIQIFFNLILFFILITVSFVGIAMCCRYVIKPSFLNFINFKAAAELIKQDIVSYFKAYLLAILCMALVYLIAFMSVSFLTEIGYFGLVIYCILVSLLWTYQIYVYAGLFSKAVIAEKI
jgi:hypothetical protein